VNEKKPTFNLVQSGGAYDGRDNLRPCRPIRSTDVVVAGVFNARQARVLEGETSLTITLEAALGAIDDAGIARPTSTA